MPANNYASYSAFVVAITVGGVAPPEVSQAARGPEDDQAKKTAPKKG
ncbi:MAG TPA: hypothetical protein VK754_06950 [Propionibacteriaceae bacterium]|nr:hypothetical protein [Propionibacteriaceae bacterium]